MRTLRLRRERDAAEIKAIESIPYSPLRVEMRPMLVAGQLSYDMEAGQAVIRVDSEILPKSERSHTLWHETIHLLRMAGNFSQDEDDVERYAAILAAACPEIIDWVGLGGEDLTASHKSHP